jgi:hypothetical protein
MEIIRSCNMDLDEIQQIIQANGLQTEDEVFEFFRQQNPEKSFDPKISGEWERWINQSVPKPVRKKAVA